MASGSSISLVSTVGILACSPRTRSCSRAAGLEVSAGTSRGKRFFFSLIHLAILAAVVVLPEPCRPTSMITAGRPLNSRSVVVPPSNSTSSSWTILVTICAGVTEVNTSSPRARSRTLATNFVTTSTATSASSSASRISRIAVSTWYSVRCPSPRKVLVTRPRRSCSASNMGPEV